MIRWAQCKHGVGIVTASVRRLYHQHSHQSISSTFSVRNSTRQATVDRAGQNWRIVTNMRLSLVLNGIAIAAFGPTTFGNQLVSSPQPSSQSNYGFYTGSFSFTDTYMSMSSRPFGVISGHASLVRHASSARSTFSISAFFENFVELPPTEFNAVLYQGSCNNTAAAPLSCDVLMGPCCENNGVNQDIVDCPSTSIHPFGTFPLTLDGSSARQQVYGHEYWSVHIPSQKAVERLSARILFSDTTVACAELINDRDLLGKQTFQLPDSQGGRPELKSIDILITEQGRTHLDLEMHNLRGDTPYAMFMHTLPCLAGRGQAPGPRYKREPNCFKNPSSSGCHSSEESEVWMFLQSNSSRGTRGTATAAMKLPFVIDASAQSLLLHDCPNQPADYMSTGVCSSGERFVFCIDITHRQVEAEISLSVPGFTQVATTIPVTTEALGGQDKVAVGDNVNTLTASTPIPQDRINVTTTWESDPALTCPPGLIRAATKGRGYEKLALDGFIELGGNATCCLAAAVTDAVWVYAKLSSSHMDSEPFKPIDVAFIGGLGVLVAGSALLVLKILKKRSTIEVDLMSSSVLNTPHSCEFTGSCKDFEYATVRSSADAEFDE